MKTFFLVLPATDDEDILNQNLLKLNVTNSQASQTKGKEKNKDEEEDSDFLLVNDNIFLSKERPFKENKELIKEFLCNNSVLYYSDEKTAKRLARYQYIHLPAEHKPIIYYAVIRVEIEESSFELIDVPCQLKVFSNNIHNIHIKKNDIHYYSAEELEAEFASSHRKRLGKHISDSSSSSDGENEYLLKKVKLKKNIQDDTDLDLIADLEQSSYRALSRRWLLREYWFFFWLEKLLLSTNNHYWNRRQHEPWRNHLLLSNNLPLFDNKAIPKRLTIFTGLCKGINDFADIVWPSTFSLLFFQDIVQYLNQPTQRFGIKFLDLFSGFYRRQWGTASGYYDTFPNETGFWTLPCSLIAAPMIMVGLEISLLFYRIRHEAALVEKFESLVAEAELSNGFRWPSLLKWLHAIPYSPYRQALTAAAYLIAWEKPQPLYFRRKNWLKLIKKIAKNAPIILAQPAIATLAKVADANNEHYNKLVEAALEELKDHPQRLRREMAHYYSWSLGQPASLKRHLFYGMLTAVYWFWYFYPAYRAAVVLYQRSEQAYEFFSNQHDCEDKNLIWHYSPVTGDYACTLCGDKPSVPALLASDPQVCLNHVLAKPAAWEHLARELSYLQKHTGYRQIVLDRQRVVNWNESFTRKFFRKLASFHTPWQALIFSSKKENNPLWPSDHKLAIMAEEFLNKVPTLQLLDFSQQNFGHDNWLSLLNHWTNPHLQQLIVRANGLDDNAIIATADWAKQHHISINHWDFSENYITDDGLTAFLASLPPGQTESLVFEYNHFTGKALDVLASWLPASGIKTVSLAQNDFTGGNYTALGEAIAQTPTLASLNLRHVQMINSNAVDLSAPWKHQTISLQVFDGSRNALTGSGIHQFGLNAGCALWDVNWSFNPIDDPGLTNIQSVLPVVCWQRIDLSGIVATASAVADFWPSLVDTTIRSVHISDNYGDTAFVTLLPLLNARNITLNELNLSGNLLSDLFAAQLFNSVCRANVNIIRLASNRLTQFKTINTWQIRDYNCTEVDLSGNLFRVDTLNPLFRRLPELPFQIIDIRQQASIGTAAGIVLAENLLKPLPSQSDLTSSRLVPDADRYIHKEARPLTQLKVVYLEKSSVAGQGEQALHNIQPHLPETTIYLTNSLPANKERAKRFVNNSRISTSRESFWYNRTQPLQPPATSTDLSAGFLLSSLTILGGLIMLLVLVLYLYKQHRQGTAGVLETEPCQETDSTEVIERLIQNNRKDVFEDEISDEAFDEAAEQRDIERLLKQI